MIMMLTTSLLLKIAFASGDKMLATRSVPLQKKVLSERRCTWVNARLKKKSERGSYLYPTLLRAAKDLGYIERTAEEKVMECTNILDKVHDYLSPHDQCALARTNKAFKQMAEDKSSKHKCLSNFTKKLLKRYRIRVDSDNLDVIKCTLDLAEAEDESLPKYYDDQPLRTSTKKIFRECDIEEAREKLREAIERAEKEEKASNIDPSDFSDEHSDAEKAHGAVQTVFGNTDPGMVNHILSYLPTHDLFAAARTNRQFRKIAAQRYSEDSSTNDARKELAKDHGIRMDTEDKVVIRLTLELEQLENSARTPFVERCIIEARKKLRRAIERANE